MSYVVLARKYRPQHFDDLVGQIPVSQTLLNAIQSGRIAHAYVFSGPRGVGKTTTARLLAKCLNCEKGPTIKPCNKCPSCVSIAQGNSVQDVLEIDGASNRGIEQIRELRESAKYAPAASRYRIYIIDEAHQITKDAFGALLKTLEEPPAHVVFMLATTEVQKIPAPILSRCQRFSLRPIAPDLVLKHLKEICKQEKVKVEEEALTDIVRFVEGSLRDALSLLDQAIVFAPDGITSNTLRDLLGLLPRDVIQKTAQLVAAGDPAALLRFIGESVQNGIDLTQLGKDLQEHYHTLLLVKAGVPDVFQAELESLKKESATYDFETLERNIRLLSKAQEDMRRSESPRAVFEVYFLRMAQKVLDPRSMLERLEKLEKTGGTGTPAPAQRFTTANPTPPTMGAGGSQTRGSTARVATENREGGSHQPPVESPTPSQPKTDSSSLSDAAVQSAWPAFVNAVGEQKVSLAAALEDAVASSDRGVLTLTFSKNFNQQLVARSTDTLKPFLNQFFGNGTRLETRVNATTGGLGMGQGSTARGATENRGPDPARPATPPKEAVKDVEMEVVPAEEAGDDMKKALKFFQGTVKKEKRGS